MKKVLFPLIVLTLIGFLTSCEKDDDHGDNEITIEFLSPASNEQVADASNVNIEIRLTATEDLEETEIFLYAELDPLQLVFEKDLHDHEKTYTFQQNVDLSAFPSGTSFLLEVETCLDHDCNEQKKEFIRFSIQ